jgi:hypothetical protein
VLSLTVPASARVPRQHEVHEAGVTALDASRPLRQGWSRRMVRAD